MADTIVNFLHILAAAVWVGGALFMKLILEPSLKVIDPQNAGKLMGTIAKRFTITAWTSLIIAIATGIYKTPSHMYFATGDEMEVYLTLKHVAIILVLIIGILIAGVVVPKMNKSMPAPGQLPSEDFLNSRKRLGMLSLISTTLAVIIVILASMLW